MELRRVVVTGLGLVTPLGTGVEAAWSNILAGKSGAGKIDDFKVDDLLGVDIEMLDHDLADAISDIAHV